VNGYTLEFLDTATGASVQVGCDDPLFSYDEDGEFDNFWWSEGNGSCDCNQNLFWNDKTRECGEGGKARSKSLGWLVRIIH
jgi:hypothetical protein